LYWNLIATSICAFHLLDVVARHTHPNERSYSMFRMITFQLSMLRLLRVLKFISVNDLFKNSFFRELQVMISSVVGTLKVLGWALIMLIMILFCFAVAFTEGFIRTLVSCDVARQDDDSEFAEARKGFGTLDRSMLSLFMAISGGSDWGDTYSTLNFMQWPYQIIFLVFVIFTMISLWNVVTAVFLESAIEQGRSSRTFKVTKQLGETAEFKATIRKVFAELDVNENGEVSITELEQKMKDPAINAYFAALGVNMHQACQLFSTLDADQPGSIDIDEFTNGCLRLKGEATSVDMAILHHEIHRVQKDLQALRRSFQAVFKRVSTDDSLS